MSPWKRKEVIGSCELYLGDCLEVMPKLSGAGIDMVLCDLPYGTTQNKWDAVIPFDALWEQYTRLTKPTSAIALFAAQPFTSLLIASNLSTFKYCWTWKKSQAVGHLNAWKQPMRNTEDIAVFYQRQCTYNPELIAKDPENIRPQTGRTKGSDNYGSHGLNVFRCPPDKTMPATVLEFANEQNTVHPTQKPVALVEYLVRTYSNEGDAVLDNTMGSGTTGVACAKTGRKFFGIERDEKYFDIAVERIRDAYRQPDFFVSAPTPQPEQLSILDGAA